MSIILTGLSAAFAGLIQGITGFGAGIVTMVFLPLFFPVAVSAGISGVVASVLNLQILLRCRHSVRIRELIVPAVIYIAASVGAIRLAPSLPATWIKLALGCFLALLSVYFLFFQKKTQRNYSMSVMVLFVLISGIGGGLFGIGGPLMALYYLGRLPDRYAYLGTTQAFFFLTALPQTLVRFASGILTAGEIAPIVVGIAAILIGGYAANRLIRVLKAEQISGATYAFVGISGLINIITALSIL